MIDTQKLTVIVTRRGSTFQVSVDKGSLRLTEEDQIQLQILEHQLRYRPETVTLNSPITLGGRD
jgi:hypothetical protein